MKILWIVNVILPFPGKHFGLQYANTGGWILGQLDCFKEREEYEIAVAALYDGKQFLKCVDNNITYYLIPEKEKTKFSKKLEEYWKYINDEFKPDIVHIYGTEFSRGYAFLKACPQVESVVTIQGLVSEIANNYFANIPIKELYKNITFRDIIRCDNMIKAQKNFEIRGENERRIILKADAIIGRTGWDFAHCWKINNNLKYYKCNENLREEFYYDKWDINNINRHQIFFSQAAYPIKGLHILIEAISIVKREYNDVNVVIAGNNILSNTSLTDKLKRTGYAKYLQSLIKKYGLENNIEFVGQLTAEGVKENLLKSNLFVISSSIENSPNSLGEAMLLSLPCVASYVGGIPELIVDNKEGLLYSYTDSAMLARNIIKIFSDDNLAIELGNNAHEHAKNTHDRANNFKKLEKIYKEVIENKK